MRYGIFSDVHSNVTALQSVLAELDGANVDRLICLGDIVGYGPNPNECCAILRQRGVAAIMGNHDEAALSNEHDEWFNDNAQAAIAWTRRNLAAENRAFLAALPAELAFDSFALVHGSPARHFDYILDVGDAVRAFRATQKPITFVGHSHVAEVYFQAADGRTFHERLAHGGSVVIESGFRYIINPGSVGQPRDRNPQASYAIYDEARGAVDVRRVNYDIGAVQRLMEEAKLPGALATRLSVGK